MPEQSLTKTVTPDLNQNPANIGKSEESVEMADVENDEISTIGLNENGNEEDDDDYHMDFTDH